MAEYIVLVGMAQAQAMALAEVRASRCPLWERRLQAGPAAMLEHGGLRRGTLPHVPHHDQERLSRSSSSYPSGSRR